MNPRSSVLVLGGTKFIGLRLTGLLHYQGHSVTILNRGKSEAVLPDGVTRLRADRGDPDQVAAALRGKEYDVVFDISAYTTSDLRPVVESLQGRVGHYVFCSSVAAYAPNDIAPIREHYPLNRGPEAGHYSRNKVLCEDMLIEAFARDGFPATMVRPPYVYGPYNHTEREPRLYARIGQGRKVLIPGEGLTQIHSVHVDDLAAAFVAIAGRDRTLGQAYNGVGDEAITENGYVAAIAEIVGRQAETVHLDHRQYAEALDLLDQSRASSVFGLLSFGPNELYSNAKLKRDTDWTPAYGIKEGLAMTHRWWRDTGRDMNEVDFSADDLVLAQLTRGRR